MKKMIAMACLLSLGLLTAGCNDNAKKPADNGPAAAPATTPATPPAGGDATKPAETPAK